MKRATFEMKVMLVMLTGMAALASAVEPEFEIYRSTVDGGGTTNSTGGAFELSDTIGQPNAGPVMTGDDFTLTGGFWFALKPGDCNTDGGVNLFDYRDFEACLSGPDGMLSPSDCGCFDLDGDTDVDLDDVGVLQLVYAH